MQRRLTPADRQALYAYREATIYLEQNGISNFSDRISEMLDQNTTDGLPYVEPELTEQDSFSRPWVMGRDRDEQGWAGPLVFIDKLPTGPFVTRSKSQGSVCHWRQCRRATPEEIAKAEWRELAE
jgi:hypothetical protein